MNKIMVLRIVNTLLFFSFIIQVITSMIIIFKIRILGMQAIFEIHEYNGMFMIAAAVMHIALNWGWVKANFFKKSGL